MDRLQIGDIIFSTENSKIIRAWLNVETNEDAGKILINRQHCIRLYINRFINLFNLDKIEYEIRNDPYAHIQEWDQVFRTWVNWIPLYCDRNENYTCFEIIGE